MAVIAVLIAIAVPSFRGMQNEAKISKAHGDMRTIKLALEAYFGKHNSYPIALPTLEAEATILQNLPSDPFGNDYLYAVDGSPANYYAVWSVGPKNAISATVAIISGAVELSGSDADTLIGTSNAALPSGNSNWQ